MNYKYLLVSHHVPVSLLFHFYQQWWLFTFHCTGQTALQPQSLITSYPLGDLHLDVEVIYVHFYPCYSGQPDDQPCCLAPRRRPRSAQHGGPFSLADARLQSSLNSCGSPSRQARWGRRELWLPSSDYNPAEHSQGLLLLPTVLYPLCETFSECKTSFFCRLVPKLQHNGDPSPERRDTRRPKEPEETRTRVKAVKLRSPAQASLVQPRLCLRRRARKMAVRHPRPPLSPLPRCRPPLFLKPSPDRMYWRCPNPRRTPLKSLAAANCCHLLMTMTFSPRTVCLASPRPPAPRPQARRRAPPPPGGPPRRCHLKRAAIPARGRKRAACSPFSMTTWMIFSREQSRHPKKKQSTRPFWTKTTRTRTFLDLAAVRPPHPLVVKKLVATSLSRTSCRYLMSLFFLIFYSILIVFSVMYVFSPALTYWLLLF